MIEGKYHLDDYSNEVYFFGFPAVNDPSYRFRCMLYIYSTGYWNLTYIDKFRGCDIFSTHDYGTFEGSKYEKNYQIRLMLNDYRNDKTSLLIDTEKREITFEKVKKNDKS